MGVNASDNECLDSKNENIPLEASEWRKLRHPAKPIHQNDTTLDATVIFNEESDEEDYHKNLSHKKTTLYKKLMIPLLRINSHCIKSKWQYL